MENKHRQTPWYVIPEENKEGFYIASTIDEDCEDVEICTVWDKWTNDQGKANAEFICRAVNNHYRLVEALREIKTLNSDYWLNHRILPFYPLSQLYQQPDRWHLTLPAFPEIFPQYLYHEVFQASL